MLLLFVFTCSKHEWADLRERCDKFFKIIGEYDKMREHRINQDSVHQEMPEFESVENWGFRVCNQPTNQKFIPVVEPRMSKIWQMLCRNILNSRKLVLDSEKFSSVNHVS